MNTRLGITSIQKNRGPWIKEWITFHYLVGFRKFYVHLHKCSDDSEKILTGLKKYFDIKIFIVDPDLENPQLICYQDTYNEFGREVDWMAFIDSDEFLFPTSKSSMEMVLSDYSNKKISALGAYWSVFGSSGFIDEPPGLIIENYRHRAEVYFEANRHIKSIVRSGLSNVFPQDPHFFLTPQGTVDEILRPIICGWTQYEPTYDKLRVNHYTCQNRSYFLKSKKNSRGPDGGDIRDEKWWKENDRNEVLDNSMDPFIEPLKDLLKSIK